MHEHTTPVSDDLVAAITVVETSLRGWLHSISEAVTEQEIGFEPSDAEAIPILVDTLARLYADHVSSGDLFIDDCAHGIRLAVTNLMGWTQDTILDGLAYGFGVDADMVVLSAAVNRMEAVVRGA